jgi:Ca2+:H+ antiporter
MIFSAGATFILSLIAIVPLAERLGFCTENLAEYFGDTIGGLLNASMGNAPELIISVLALRDGLLRVVQLSLLGSVLSNLLLVLGTALILGGIKHRHQQFNSQVTDVSNVLLMLSSLCVLLPGILASSATERDAGSSHVTLSRVISILMLIVYISYIIFQLYTHTDMYQDSEDPPVREVELAGHSHGATAPSHATVVPVDSSPEENESGGEEGEKEEPDLSMIGALVLMAAVSAVIAVVSEALVGTCHHHYPSNPPARSTRDALVFVAGSIEGASEAANIPDLFVSCILLPIAGNAAEHWSALTFAWRNRLDVTIGIAVGSATQISLFVLPLMVIIAWGLDKSLSLNFYPFETAVWIVTSLVVVTLISGRGQSHWLKGVMLVVAYICIAASFLFHTDAGA